MLSRLAQTVSNSGDLESLTRPLLELLQAVTGLESTYLTHVDIPAGMQHVLYSQNTQHMQIPEGLSVPWGDTLCRRALEEDRPFTDDVASCWGDSEAARALGIKTYLSQPVRYGSGELYGTLCAASERSVKVGPDALKLLGMFASILTLQVERERRMAELGTANAALSQTALTDPLTGVANRRALDECVARALARADRDGQKVQVAFIDLDGFKAINDRHGHEIGDRFLKAIAGRIKQATRMSELVGRYGGDEFVVVAEGDRVGELATRLDGVITGRYELGDLSLDYPGASIGVVSALPGETATALLTRADSAMYAIKKARKAGRLAAT